ncbi:MAG: CpaF family protein [Henriciella sp.]
MKFSFIDKPSKQKTEKVSGNTRSLEPVADLSDHTSDLLYFGSKAEADFSREYLGLKVKLHQKMISQLNLHALDKVDREVAKKDISVLLNEMLEAEGKPLSASERLRLAEEILDELKGFGPLEPLLADPTVSDILVNSPDEVFVERAGRLEETDVHFSDDDHLMRIIDRIVTGVGRRIDESNPLVDARLPDGSRVNAVIPPITLDGASMSIRKFSKIPFDLERLVAIGSMTEDLAEILRGIVACRLNILISGGTGTGKTTMLNAMSRFIGQSERIVTIEDAAELQLQQRHVVRMETRPPNIEDKGEVNQRMLVKNALRMRPDRIILGEVRGGEAFDMLQAMNTGHDGSITTVHANSPRDALSRLEQMIGMAGMDLTTKSVRGQIASALDVVVQIKRFADGTRRVVSVMELTGMEGDVVTLQEIFRFDQSHIDPDGKVHGSFKNTGVRPDFLSAFKANGLPVPASFEM